MVKQMNLTDLGIIALANLTVYYTRRMLNQNIIRMNLEFVHPHGMNHLMYQIDFILSLIDKTILNTLLKNKKLLQKRILIKIYVNKIKNRIVFKIKTGYKLELLSEETMQLLGSSKKDIDQDKDGELYQK